MRTRPLGRSGLMVSTVGVGCNAFGSRVDETRTKEVVHAAVDAALRSFFAPRSRTDGTVRMGVVFRCYLAERAR